MVSSDFMQLMKRLGERVDINLDATHENVIAVKFNDGTVVNFEEDPENNKLILNAVVGNIGSTGAYRENFLRAALQANHQRPPRFGIFSYLDGSDRVMLHETFDLSQVTAGGLIDYLAEFCYKAAVWEEHLNRGEIPDAAAPSAPQAPSRGGPGMFGVRP